MTDMALADEAVAVQLVSFLPIGESGPSRSVNLLLPQCELRNHFESFTIDNLPVRKRDWLGRKRSYFPTGEVLDRSGSAAAALVFLA